MSSRALLLDSDLSLYLGDVPTASAGVTDATVCVEWAGLSPEDAEALRSGEGVSRFPAVLGREVVGIVEECPGEELAVGARVVVDPRESCGHCTTCARSGVDHDDRVDRCRETTYLGTDRPGGLAGSVRVKARRCVPVPDEVDPALACLAWPMAVALHRLEIWSSGVAGRDPRSVEMAGFDAVAALVLVELLRRNPATAVTVHARSNGEAALAQGLGASVVTTDAAAPGSDALTTAPLRSAIDIAPDALQRGLQIVTGEPGRFQPVVTAAIDLDEASTELAGLLLGGPGTDRVAGKVLVRPWAQP